MHSLVSLLVTLDQKNVVLHDSVKSVGLATTFGCVHCNASDSHCIYQPCMGMNCFVYGRSPSPTQQYSKRKQAIAERSQNYKETN